MRLRPRLLCCALIFYDVLLLGCFRPFPCHHLLIKLRARQYGNVRERHVVRMNLVENLCGFLRTLDELAFAGEAAEVNHAVRNAHFVHLFAGIEDVLSRVAFVDKQEDFIIARLNANHDFIEAMSLDSLDVFDGFLMEIGNRCVR